MRSREAKTFLLEILLAGALSAAAGAFFCGAGAALFAALCGAACLALAAGFCTRRAREIDRHSEYLAGVGAIKPHEQIKHRGLSSAGNAAYDDAPSVGYREVEVLKHLFIAVAFAYLSKFHHARSNLRQTRRRSSMNSFSNSTLTATMTSVQHKRSSVSRYILA